MDASPKQDEPLIIKLSDDGLRLTPGRAFWVEIPNENLNNDHKG